LYELYSKELSQNNLHYFETVLKLIFGQSAENLIIWKFVYAFLGKLYAEIYVSGADGFLITVQISFYI